MTTVCHMNHDLTESLKLCNNFHLFTCVSLCIRYTNWLFTDTAQKMKFSIKDFFSKCDQIHRNLRIWLHLLKKSLMENFIFLCNENLLHCLLVVATSLCYFLLFRVLSFLFSDYCFCILWLVNSHILSTLCFFWGEPSFGSLFSLSASFPCYF